ncbi:MAG: D-glycero-beta-D-manno-heptose 1-phosphate adenylyltransferase [Desulfobacterales bacterium]
MPDKLLTKDNLAKVLGRLQKAGKRIVFTNGCFDILHVGHVRYLAAAKSEGDFLVVGLNSDASVKSIKGAKRPVIPEGQRAEVLACLSCVDYITLFDEPDPLKLIQALKPNVLVKGDDWLEEQIVGADFVKSRGGRVVRVPTVRGASTSHIIKRIIRLFGVEP